MKKLFVLFFLSLCFFWSNGKTSAQEKCQLAENAYPGSPKFERQGQALLISSDNNLYKSVSVSVSLLLSENKNLMNCRILEFSFDTFFRDTLTPKPTDEISFSFESISNNFSFDVEADRKLFFQADGKNVLNTALTQKWRDERSKTVKREHLSSKINLNFAGLKELSNAKKITIKLGKKTFVLTAKQKQGIIDFYNAINKT